MIGQYLRPFVVTGGLARLQTWHGTRHYPSLLRQHPPTVLSRSFGQPAAQTHPHLLSEGDVTPGISRQEYRTRRHSLVGALVRDRLQAKTGQPSLVIIPSASQKFMSHDIPYPFRQNTDFLYLTGFLEPNSILVLQTSSGSDISDHTSTLFVQKKDPLRELWDGPRSGCHGAVTLTGVDQAFNIDLFEDYMTNWLAKNDVDAVWYEQRRPAHPEYHVNRISKVLSEKNWNKVESPRRFVQLLRLVKSPAEVALMRRSCEVTSEAFVEVMKFSKPYIDESHLYAKMDFECRVRGAEYLAYPPVVAGGDRANIIHYVSNNQLIRDGELVLMDAGCEYHAYTSDVTRTWPVNGRFTACQREVYEALLEVQQQCIALCRSVSSISMDRLYLEMLSLIGQQLMRIGVVRRSMSGDEIIKIARQVCPHHLGHYLGMDVHDTDEIPRTIALTPGMIITVEPGIYIPRDTNLDVPSDMRGIGIRIEDDVLITGSEPEVLTRHCPKHPDQLEALVGSK